MLVMATCSRSMGGVGVSGGVQDTNRTIAIVLLLLVLEVRMLV